MRRHPRRLHEGAGRARARRGRGASAADALKVALVHDWLTGMRGGEKVLLSLARLFPDAPIFTLLHVQGLAWPRAGGARRSAPRFVQRLPGVERALPPLPAALPRRRRHASTSRGYDLVISSSHCVAKGVRVAAGRAAPLLLPHADALRVGPLRRLLRPGPRAPASRGRVVPAGRRGPARLGRGHRARASTTSRPTAPTWPAASAATTAATPR